MGQVRPFAGGLLKPRSQFRRPRRESPAAAALAGAVVSGADQPPKPTTRCRHFPRCGGCDSLHLAYRQELERKRVKLEAWFGALARQPLAPLLPSAEPFNYRYKLQAPFGRKRVGKSELITLGLLARDHSELVDQTECKIQAETLTLVLREVRIWARAAKLSVYNDRAGKGLLRHLVVRKSRATGELLVILVTREKDFPRREEHLLRLQEALLAVLQRSGRGARLAGILQNVNPRRTAMALGPHTHLVYGRDSIEERIGDLTFQVGAGTFFQVNPFQIEPLYNLVRQYVPSGAVALDLYAGMGTLSAWLAAKAARVFAVEDNPASVRAGIAALQTNEIANVRLQCAKAAEFLKRALADKRKYDFVSLDPPREGLEPETCEALVALKAPRIVYVSCDPESLARDVGRLSGAYQLVSVQGVDMFPFTDHIEAVALLERR